MSNAVSEVRRRMAAVTDVDPDTVLITFYVSKELPPEERQRVEERMRVDPVFRRALEAAEAIRALPAWVGMTEEDAQWIRFARQRRPHLTRASGVRAISSARSALWVRAQWVAGIASIAVLSGAGVEAARVALGAHDTDQRQVATSASPVDVSRSAPIATGRAPTRTATATAPATARTRPGRTPTLAPTPPQVVAAAGEPARLPPSTGALPVVAASTASPSAAPTNSPLGHVAGERPCVFDPVLSTLAAVPDSTTPNKLADLLQLLPSGRRVGADQVGRVGIGRSEDLPPTPPPAPKICVGTTNTPKAP